VDIEDDVAGPDHYKHCIRILCVH